MHVFQEILEETPSTELVQLLEADSRPACRCGGKDSKGHFPALLHL